MIGPEKVCHVVEIFWERVDNNNQDWPQIRNKKLEANMLLILMICCGHFHMLWATNQNYIKLQANMLLILMRCCGPFSVHPVMHQNFDHTIALKFLQHQTPFFVEDNPCRFWPSLSNDYLLWYPPGTLHNMHWILIRRIRESFPRDSFHSLQFTSLSGMNICFNFHLVHCTICTGS